MKISFIFFLLSILAACSTKQPAELQVLHDEVMAIHDEVMPKMRDINRSKKALRQIQNPESDSLIAQLILDLDAADEAMMSWMAQFKKPNPDDPESAKTYYAGQKVGIEEVKNQMLGSISKANEIISKNTE